MFKVIKYFLILFFGLVVINVTLEALVKKKRKNDYIIVELSDLKKEEINKITRITDSIVTTIQNGGYYKFSNRFNEYTPIKKLDQSTQRYYQKMITDKYGDFKGLELNSVLKSKSGNTFYHKLYRFKGIFDSNKNVEVRAYVNDKAEVISTNIIPWKRKYIN